jgi:phenylacetate-CoA ligase
MSNGTLNLSEVWPGISYNPLELSSAYIFREVLTARMNAFTHAIAFGNDYRAKAIDDFNNWIRFEIPAYKSFGPVSDFAELPYLTKRTFRQNSEQYKSTGVNPDTAWLKRTTGSTGHPQTIVYSTAFHHETVLLAVPKIAYRLRLSPGPENGIYAMSVRDKPGEAPIARIDVTVQGRVNVRMGVDTSMPESIVEAITNATKVKPFCISSNPTLLTAITQVISPELARKTGVKLIVSGGAALPAATRTRLQELFNAVVCSAYGLSETGVIASECPHGATHFNMSDCYVESLPAKGMPGLEEIVLTATNNHAMPFLRYRTGDLGKISFERCACGESSPILSALNGRVVPVFRLPSGNLFSPTQFRNTFDKFPWLKEFQVIQQQANLVQVLYECNELYSMSAEEEKQLVDYFTAPLETGVNVVLEKHLFPQNDKFQRYKSLVDQ